VTRNKSRKGEMKMNIENRVFEITEEIYMAKELEKYTYLGAVASLTELIYKATRGEEE
jgi:hypothetical protein